MSGRLVKIEANFSVEIDWSCAYAQDLFVAYRTVHPELRASVLIQATYRTCPRVRDLVGRGLVFFMSL